MKNSAYILIALTLPFLVACDKTKQNEQKKEPTPVDTVVHTAHHEGDSIEVFIVDTLSGDIDTIHVTPTNTVIKLPVDRTEKAKKKAEERRKAANNKKTNAKANTQTTNGQTSDLSMFDIKGPVSLINYTQGFVSSYNQIVNIAELRDLVTITPDGRWKPTGRYDVKRDAKGRIIKLTRLQDKITNEFTYKGNLVNTVKVYSQTKRNVYSIATLKRGTDGLVNGYTASIILPGDNGMETVTVKVLKRDNYGNWTRRRFRTSQETRIEERVIEYRK